MGNKEKRVYNDHLHLYLAFQRQSKQGKTGRIRTVIKDEELDLKILEAKLKVIGGEWRIHKTVNIRNVEKARKWLLKRLIDMPEQAGAIDSLWRTALLQRECKETKLFMLDIDTQDEEKLKIIDKIVDPYYHTGMKIKSPSGWHYITDAFDTREICKLDYVTLLRDGYYYIKTVGEK